MDFILPSCGSGFEENWERCLFRVGTVLEPFGSVLEVVWKSPSTVSGPPLGPSWALLGPFWACLGATWGSSWVILWSGSHPEAYWGVPGRPSGLSRVLCMAGLGSIQICPKQAWGASKLVPNGSRNRSLEALLGPSSGSLSPLGLSLRPHGPSLAFLVPSETSQKTSFVHLWTL